MIFPLQPTMSWIVFLIVTFFAVRHAAVVSGLYKDPLLAHFRKYGPETRSYPLVNLLFTFGGWSFVAMMLVRSGPTYQRMSATGSPATALFVLTIMCMGGSALVQNQPKLRESLPLWYFELLHTATRQERRFIAYAWLRLPLKMRWRLNGDQRAFRVWADMVRIAFIYGAYDPDSTWDRWGN